MVPRDGINTKSFFYYQKVLRDEMIEKSESGCSLPSFVDVTTQLHTPETYETTSPTFDQHEQPTFAHSKHN